MKRLLLPLLAVFVLPTVANTATVYRQSFPSKTLTAESHLLSQISCKNTNVLTYKTSLGRRGFFSWLNDDFSESIDAYSEYLVCFKTTKGEAQMAATIRGLAKEAMGNTKSACWDWAKGRGNPYYWSSFKKQYKKLIRRENHEDAFNKVMSMLNTSNEEESSYKLKTCKKYLAK